MSTFLNPPEHNFGISDLRQKFPVVIHQTNRSKYTRFKGPWNLIFVRTFTEKSEALRFEKYLKKLRNKEYIRRVYAEYFVHS